MLKLRPFQRPIVKAVESPDWDIIAVSIPRGNGKSTLAAYILERTLTPGDSLFLNGDEAVLTAASIDQARLTFKIVRQALGEDGYRYNDSNTRLNATHIATGSRLRCISSTGKTTMGLVGVKIAVVDECGSFEVNGGRLQWDALVGALGKPDSPMKILAISTVAPSLTGWWADLIKAGTVGRTWVYALQGDAARWDVWKEVRRVNPLAAISPELRQRLRAELKEAYRDTSKRAYFTSYRLNQPTGDSATMLLPLEDWQLVTAREVPPATGKAIIGADMGGGRAWCSAVAIHSNGRCAAFALTPGIPSIADQEKRDLVAAGTYQKLVDADLLIVADGLRVPPPSMLWDEIRSRWGRPASVVCDRFRLSELQDAAGGDAGLVTPRVTRWSESAEDIRALRKISRDGPLAVVPESRLLLAASLSVATVKNDDQGNTRLQKLGHNNSSRDDVAAGLVLAAGAHSRAVTQARPRWRYRGAA